MHSEGDVYLDFWDDVSNTEVYSSIRLCNHELNVSYIVYPNKNVNNANLIKL